MLIIRSLHRSTVAWFEWMWTRFHDVRSRRQQVKAIFFVLHHSHHRRRRRPCLDHASKRTTKMTSIRNYLLNTFFPVHFSQTGNLDNHFWQVAIVQGFFRWVRAPFRSARSYCLCMHAAFPRRLAIPFKARARTTSLHHHHFFHGQQKSSEQAGYISPVHNNIIKVLEWGRKKRLNPFIHSFIYIAFD